MSEGGKLLWTERIVVRWGDMDALGHVNNAQYFRYLEQARVSWFESLGLPMAEENLGPVIVRASCDFLIPITYPAVIRIPVVLARVGRSSFALTHEFLSEADPAVRFATGEAVIVWIDHARGKSVPLPDRLLRHLA